MVAGETPDKHYFLDNSIFSGCFIPWSLLLQKVRDCVSVNQQFVNLWRSVRYHMLVYENDDKNIVHEDSQNPEFHIKKSHSLWLVLTILQNSKLISFVEHSSF